MLGPVYEVIVVGTDGSETAGVARQAVALAKLSGATLPVVHAHQPLSASRASMGASAVSMAERAVRRGSRRGVERWAQVMNGRRA